MPRPCLVCTHPDRNAIELDIATRNGSNQTVSKRYPGLSKGSVFRHRRDHLLSAAVAVAQEREKFTIESIVAKLQEYVEIADKALQQAQEAKDVVATSRALKEARETVVALGKTLGMFQRDVVVTDNRTQIMVNLDQLSVEDLRALAGECRNDVRPGFLISDC